MKMPADKAPPPRDHAIQHFRDELITIRDALRRQDWDQLLSGPWHDTELEDRLPAAIRTRLLQAAESLPTSETPATPTLPPTATSPRTLLATVADAVLLHEVAWPGRDEWARHPLQSQVDDHAPQSLDIDASHEIARHLQLAFNLGYLSRQATPSGLSDELGDVSAPPLPLIEIVYQFQPAPWHPEGDLMAGTQDVAALRVDHRSSAAHWWMLFVVVCLAGLVTTLLIWREQVAPIEQTPAARPAINPERTP